MRGICSKHGSCSCWLIPYKLGGLDCHSSNSARGHFPEVDRGSWHEPRVVYPGCCHQALHLLHAVIAGVHQSVDGLGVLTRFQDCSLSAWAGKAAKCTYIDRFGCAVAWIWPGTPELGWEVVVALGLWGHLARRWYCDWQTLHVMTSPSRPFGVDTSTKTLPTAVTTLTLSFEIRVLKDFIYVQICMAQSTLAALPFSLFPESPSECTDRLPREPSPPTLGAVLVATKLVLINLAVVHSSKIGVVHQELLSLDVALSCPNLHRGPRDMPNLAPQTCPGVVLHHRGHHPSALHHRPSSCWSWSHGFHSSGCWRCCRAGFPRCVPNAWWHLSWSGILLHWWAIGSQRAVSAAGTGHGSLPLRAAAEARPFPWETVAPPPSARARWRTISNLDNRLSVPSPLRRVKFKRSWAARRRTSSSKGPNRTLNPWSK